MLYVFQPLFKHRKGTHAEFYYFTGSNIRCHNVIKSDVDLEGLIPDPDLDLTFQKVCYLERKKQ